MKHNITRSLSDELCAHWVRNNWSTIVYKSPNLVLSDLLLFWSFNRSYCFTSLYKVTNIHFICSRILKKFTNERFTRDIADTPSKAYTTFDTRPSPLWDMTWMAVMLNDPSVIQFMHSNKETRPTSKKPEE